MLPILQDNSNSKMSLKEITDLIGVRHDKACLKVLSMAEEPEFGTVSIIDIVYNDKGQTVQTYMLDRRQSIAVAARLNTALMMRVIDRWQALENQTAKNQILVPDFSNPAEAARAWATQYEAAQFAIATKAEIGSRREATAMNTASQAVKHANKLEIELDRSKQFSSVKRMEMLYHGQKFNWRELKSTCAIMGLYPIDIFDANYGTVKAWPSEVWREAYALEII